MVAWARAATRSRGMGRETATFSDWWVGWGASRLAARSPKLPYSGYHLRQHGGFLVPGRHGTAGELLRREGG